MSLFSPRCFGFWTLVGLLIFVSPLRANENLWSITAVGGGAPEETDFSFYQGMVDMREAIQSFNVTSTRQKNYFGPSSGPICYTEQSPAETKRIDERLSQLRKNPLDCSPVTEIIYSELGQFVEVKAQNKVCNQAPADIVKDLGSTGHGENFISGPATKKNILDSLSDLIPTTGSGQKHLLLTLDDHGLKEGTGTDSEWVVGLGDTNAKISSQELQPQLEKLRKSGVTIHLQVDACFSGGFNRLSNVANGPSEGTICSTTVTDENTMSSGTNDPVKNKYKEQIAKNLKKYHNQLQAHACSIGQDSWNRPQSSLDLIIKDWAAHEAKPAPECLGAKNSDDLKAQLQALVKIGKMADPFRQAMAEAYKTYFANVLIDCVKDRVDDVALAEEMRSCLVTGKTQVHPTILPMVVEVLSAPKAQDVDIAQISKDMQFITEADTPSLRKFQASFCCLAYDLKTGEVPLVCKL